MVKNINIYVLMYTFAVFIMKMSEIPQRRLDVTSKLTILHLLPNPYLPPIGIIISIVKNWEFNIRICLCFVLYFIIGPQSAGAIMGFWELNPSWSSCKEIFYLLYKVYA